MRSVKVFALLALMSGCATSAGRGKFPAEPIALGGAWDGLSRTTVETGASAGDTRVERQAWLLEQRGTAVTGFYVVELTMTSGDGRPFQCSGTTAFSTVLRYDVKGEIRPDGIAIEEVGA